MTEGTPVELMTDPEISEELAFLASQYRANAVFGEPTTNRRRNELVNERARRTAITATETT